MNKKDPEYPNTQNPWPGLQRSVWFLAEMVNQTDLMCAIYLEMLRVTLQNDTFLLCEKKNLN